MAKLGQILIIEDSMSLAKTYEAYLKPLNVKVRIAYTGAEARAALKGAAPDVVLLDLKLPDADGLAILEEIQQHQLDSSVVVMTAHGSVKTAVAAMRCGALDFLLKPFDAERLMTTVNNALEVRRLERLVAKYQNPADDDRLLENLIGKSAPMKAVQTALRNAAPSRAPVFLVGESGTGKELCAEAIHGLSPRSPGPFVAINCAAIPKDLIESEIFGHVQGAFTGATSGRDGAAVQADGGTLFLDEICEMDLSLQGKLLRFIQSGQVQPVGGDNPRSVDIRFVCATNRDPWSEVQAGRFREDLYFRLHVIPITLPPLRTRGGDVMDLAQAFLDEFSREEGKSFQRFSATASEVIQTYRWPGNVRELRNSIHRVVVLHDSETVEEHMLPDHLFQQGTGQSTRQTGSLHAMRAGAKAVVADDVPGEGATSTTKSAIRPLAEVERDAIERALELCDGNVAQAAGRLEISPSTLYRKLQTWQKTQSA